MTISTANPVSVTTDRSRLIARLGQNTTADSITKRAAGETAPLSYSQERLWIMSQLEPDNPIYNVAGAVRLDGALRGELLAQALSEVVRRHEILRSRFLALEGGPASKSKPKRNCRWKIGICRRWRKTKKCRLSRRGRKTSFAVRSG